MYMVVDYSEDRELLTLLRRGEISAFVDIYTAYYDALLNYADRLLNDMEAARDVVQQVYYKMWENRDTLNISLSVKAYLFIEQAIQEAIAILPEKCREVFVLSKIEGLKNREIAEKLNISEKTVERHMSIALSKLREELDWLLQIILFFSFSHWG